MFWVVLAGDTTENMGSCMGYVVASVLKVLSLSFANLSLLRIPKQLQPFNPAGGKTIESIQSQD